MSSYRKSKRRKFIDPDIIEVKSKFYAEFRRFALHKSECTKFARFRELLQETFVLNEMPFTICYTDPLHGDLLPINNDENFARALTTVTNNACLLRILLQKMDEDPGQITGYGNQPNSLKKRNRLSQYILNVVPNYYNIAAESLYTNLLLNTGTPVNSSHYTPDNGINPYPYQISNGDLHRRQKSSPILDPMYNTWGQQSTNLDVPPQNYYMPNHPHTIKLLNGHAAHNSISTTHYQPTATQNYANTPRASKPLIGRPLDFRTVSSIIDVDTVPKTLRRVRLVKPRRPVLPCPHSLITMTAKDNIGANNFDNYNTNHSSNHQYSSTSSPANGLHPATAQSTPQYYDDRPLGFYIRQGISVRIGSEGLERYPAIFISRLVPGGIAAGTGLLSLGDEIVEVNGIDLSGKTLDQVTDMMIANAYDLVLTVRPADQASTLARGRPIIPSNYSAQGTTVNSVLHNDESFPYTSSHSNNKTFINSKSYHNINDEIHYNEGKSNAVSKDGPKILSAHENTMNGISSTQSVTPAHTKTNINTSEIFNHIRNLNINENLTVYQNGIMNISTSKYGANNFIPSTSISRTPEIMNHDKTNNFYTPNGNDNMEFITPPSIKRRAPKPPLLCSKI